MRKAQSLYHSPNENIHYLLLLPYSQMNEGIRLKVEGRREYVSFEMGFGIINKM